MSEISRREWAELAAVSAVSILLYQINAMIFYLVPLQVLCARRGVRMAARGGLIILVVSVAIASLRLGRNLEGSLGTTLVALEAALHVSLLGAIVLAAAPWSFYSGSRRLVKLLAITAAFGLASIPLIRLVSNSQEINAVFVRQIEAFRSAVDTENGLESPAVTALAELLSDPDQLIDFVAEAILRTYLFWYFVFVAASIWIGELAASRTRQGIAYPKISQFSVPDRGVWVLAASWAVILLDRLLDQSIGPARFGAWNLALISALIYAVQGAAIIRHLLIERGVSRAVRTVLLLVILFVLFIPRVNRVVLIGIPVLGVSETWIKFRIRSKE